MSSRRSSDKQIQAMTFNLKEDRVLEKTLQTLDLEQSYSLKLIHLDHREIKVSQKRMKSRIGKIKSYLEPETIAEFQALEYEGKLKSGYQPITVSGAIRIAAATKRLKLQSDWERLQALRSARRSPTTTEVFEDSPEPQQAPAPDTASKGNLSLRPPHLHRGRRNSFASISTSPTRVNTPSPRPDHVEKDTQQQQQQRKRRPATCVAPSRTRVLSPGRHTARPETAYGYSSHDPPEKHRPLTSRQTRNKGRRMSVMSGGSVESDLEKERDAEMRQELLDMEQLHQGHLEDRTKDFLDRAKKWAVERTPAPKPTNKDQVLSAVNVASKLVSSAKKPAGPPTGHMSGFTGASSLEVVSPGEERTKKLLDAWKDLKKCRYLRLPEEQQDLSGVNTLASTQMKLFEAMKNKRLRSPKPGAATGEGSGVRKGTVCQATEITPPARTVETVQA